jgi:hypothetical protein
VSPLHNANYTHFLARPSTTIQADVTFLPTATLLGFLLIYILVSWVRDRYGTWFVNEMQFLCNLRRAQRWIRVRQMNFFANSFGGNLLITYSIIFPQRLTGHSDLLLSIFLGGHRAPN